ncbi:hypothetical protein AVEN_249185-1 [Araneus ventricosus]|uniref:Uncharacterized protein n=1 Tax=Araneus ventricosus TaxID=182803 RepID=A0A4Y2V4L2_ARAVE|nr:hypothetical protein AVEN_249185-1 [Araneus ventricosus]
MESFPVQYFDHYVWCKMMEALSSHPVFPLHTGGGRREWKAFSSTQFPLTTGGGRYEWKAFHLLSRPQAELAQLLSPRFRNINLPKSAP